MGPAQCPRWHPEGWEDPGGFGCWESGAACHCVHPGGQQSRAMGAAGLEAAPHGKAPGGRSTSSIAQGGSAWSLLLLGLCCDATKAEALPLGLELCLQGMCPSLPGSRCLAQPAPRVWEQGWGRAPRLGGGSVGHASGLGAGSQRWKPPADGLQSKPARGRCGGAPRSCCWKVSPS